MSSTTTVPTISLSNSNSSTSSSSISPSSSTSVQQHHGSLPRSSLFSFSHRGFTWTMILMNCALLSTLYLRESVTPVKYSHDAASAASEKRLQALMQRVQEQKEEEEEEEIMDKISTTIRSSGATTTTTTSGRIRVQPCPDALRFFDRLDLETSIRRSQDFHHRGGNLKQVQLLLDNHIDATVKKLGLKFLPKDNPTEGATQAVTKHLKEYYATHYDARGGYGKPLPGKYDKSHPLLMEGRYVEVADPIGTKERWDASLGPIGPNCTNLLTIGDPKNYKDGDKWMCQPLNTSSIREQHNNNDNNNENEDDLNHDEEKKEEDCHIISIGGNDNWKFEQRIRKQMPHCTTHTFDCTLPGGKPKRKPKNDDQILFYNYCIHSYNHVDPHGRHYITYFDMIQHAQLTKPPLLFKIDVEGFEFDIFAHMIQQASLSAVDHKLLNNLPLGSWLPQQIVVELHWATRMTGVAWMPRTRNSAELALLSNMLFTGGGYQPIFTSWIPQCASCMEVLYFRTQC